VNIKIKRSDPDLQMRLDGSRMLIKVKTPVKTIRALHTLTHTCAAKGMQVTGAPSPTDAAIVTRQKNNTKKLKEMLKYVQTV
jgi:hypothetical protein